MAVTSASPSFNQPFQHFPIQAVARADAHSYRLDGLHRAARERAMFMDGVP
jgi:hypothetical protein